MIVGIDASLSSTGVVILSDEGKYLWADQITSDKADPIHVRCRSIVRRVLGGCSLHEDAVWDVFMEEPMGGLQGEAGDLRTLFWFIVEALCDWEHAKVSIYSISAKGLTKWVTGDGGASSGDKAYCISQKWMERLPEAFWATDSTKPKGLMRWADLWDALALCMVGRHYLGLDGGNKAQQEAIANIKKIV